MVVLYRKYRPQSLDELIGQEGVKSALLQAFKLNKLSHAYLFAGPRGTGKTSLARILAKMVNCLGSDQKGPAGSQPHRASSHSLTASAGAPRSPLPVLSVPCNQCSSCISITDGSNLDLIEIDAASNRGIDDVRTLRENIKLAPSSGRKKVYIIDEIHMLTTEAFNALLKTLEEPPNHVLFILATTEISKIPQTILSRVTKLDFKLARINDMIKALKIVISGEKIKIGDEALKILAKKAEGSFRDGVKFLDQISSLTKEVTVKDVEGLLQVGNFDSGVAILEKLVEDNSKDTLSLITKQEESGMQAKELTLFLLELLRYLFFIKNDLGHQLVKEEVGSDKYGVLETLVEKFSTTSDVAGAINKLQNTLEKIRVSTIPYLPLELAVVEICEEMQKSKGKSQKFEEKTIEYIPERGNKVEMDKSAVKSLLTEKDMSDLSKIKEKWSFVLETIRPFNYSLEALLRNTKIAEATGSVVVLEVPYSFHQRILEAPKSKDLLESVLADILGKSVKVSTVLGSRPQRVEDIANVEIAGEDEIITMASEIFNGKLVD